MFILRNLRIDAMSWEGVRGTGAHLNEVCYSREISQKWLNLGGSDFEGEHFENAMILIVLGYCIRFWEVVRVRSISK